MVRNRSGNCLWMKILYSGNCLWPKFLHKKFIRSGHHKRVWQLPFTLATASKLWQLPLWQLPITLATASDYAYCWFCFKINSELWQLPQKVWQLPLKVWQLPLPSLTSSWSVLAPDSLSDSLIRQPYQTASSDSIQIEEAKIIWPPQNTNLH